MNIRTHIESNQTSSWESLGILGYAKESFGIHVKLKKSYRIQDNPMRNPMESYVIQENHQESTGTIWNHIESKRTLSESYGNLWESKKIFGNSMEV